ncbi:MAG TPA: FtsW/RodA/SpoVE family cell cycle protein [Candidatus Kapabacteria bacterium]|nr:FtsW/RodA/SpoVE family cell cycle protein [Candidatus Kapabacteria bacterium]
MSRAVSYPVLALLVIALAAVANVAVYQAGMEWFVGQPSLWIVIRNVLAVAVIVLAGGALIPRDGRTRSAELVLLLAAALFGIGSAVQFRLGSDAPRQLSNNEITAVRDSMMSAMHGRASEAQIREEAASVVRQRNGALRRDFEQSRIDTRLARSLEAAYGPTPDTRRILESRPRSSGDSILFRVLPVLVLLGALLLFGRTSAATLLSSQWRLAGFYGSIAVCLLTLVYLMMSGGVRGANFAPQELLKLTLPIAWAGLLIHYRAAFVANTRERFARSPLVLWLYTLLLLSSPLLSFIVVRDFGQFLVISIAQTLLLGYYTRSALYVVLFVAATLATSMLLLGDTLFTGTTLLITLAIVVGAVVVLGALERFQRRETLWASASGVLVLYVTAAFLLVRIPFVMRLLATPRQRFLLWADLYSRHGNPTWWDSSRQIVEALYALDAGGAAGRGLGYGTPFLIPKASSDFVFAAIVEEMGSAGGILVILSFIALVVIGLRIASKMGRDTFGGILVAGYTLLVASQAFVHIAGTMNILPMTGITLPLVSSGMSSLLVSWAIIGAVIALSARPANAGQRLTIRHGDRG